MQELEQAIRKLENLDLGKVALKVVEDESHVAIDLITEGQLFERGIDSEGKSLGEYAPFTIEQKKKKGQRYDHVTLKDEGDFHRGVFMKSKGGDWPLGFDSKDSKTDMLIDTYGPVLDLTDQSTEQLNNDIEEHLVDACGEAIESCLK